MSSTPSKLSPSRCLAALALLAGLAISACASDASDSKESAPEAVMAADCTALAQGGSVNVCHATGDAEQPYSALKVTPESCKSGHAGHLNDFVSADESGCALLAKPAAGGTCKASGQACSVSRAGECCSFTCLCLTKKCTCG